MRRKRQRNGVCDRFAVRGKLVFHELRSQQIDGARPVRIERMSNDESH